MKKLLSIISFLFIISACTKKQPEPAQESLPIKLDQGITAQESSCKIANYDCWDIIEDLKKDTIRFEDKFYNHSLENKGLLLTQYSAEIFESRKGTLSNQVEISINYDNCNVEYGYATISDPTRKIKFTYDGKGNIVSSLLPESSCKINNYDCSQIIKDLKSNSEGNIYNNPALQEKGLSIINYEETDNGNSQSYILSNDMIILVNNNISSCTKKTCGNTTTIIDPTSKKKFTYDKENNLESIGNFVAETLCTIHRYSCWDVIQDLKETTDYSFEQDNIKHTLYKNPALERKGEQVIAYSKNKDGSEFYKLSSQITISINNNWLSKEKHPQGYASVSNPFIKKKFIFDNQGKLIDINNLD